MRNVEYRPSRRSSAPFSPSGAASYAARIASLYFAVNVRPTRAFGHLRVRPCRASAIHRTRIFDPGPSVKPGQADRHVGEVSIPTLGSMIVRGRVPQPRLAERGDAGEWRRCPTRGPDPLAGLCRLDDKTAIRHAN